MANAGRYDLQISAGEDFARTLTIAKAGTDYTGATFAAQIRRGFSPAAPLVQALTCSVVSAGVGQAVVRITLTAAQTRALLGAGERDWVKRTDRLGAWDFETTLATGAVERPLEGEVTLSAECTR